MTTKILEWKARPTVYRGVQMRSRLEAAWAEQWDAEGVEWKYEPRCFASERGQYLPDFLLPGPWVYVEVKPVSFLGGIGGYPRYAAACARWLRIMKASDEDARLWLATSADDDGYAYCLETAPLDPEDEGLPTHVKPAVPSLYAPHGIFWAVN